MKILPFANGIVSDIARAGKVVSSAGIEGEKIGSRAAKIYKQNDFNRYVNVTRSVSYKLSKKITIKELPYIAGAIGFITPIPFMSVILLSIGFAVRGMVSVVKKISGENQKV